MVAAQTAENFAEGSAVDHGRLEAEEVDQRVILHGMTWKDYEIILAVRGERSLPRIYYLDGEIELMNPSWMHEDVKTTIARLLEAYADERGLEFNGYGQWTLRKARKKRAAEADECYILGAKRKSVPDLAIEIMWSRGGLNKLKIYSGLGVRELWIWDRKGSIQVHILRGQHYEPSDKSELLPELDLGWLVSFLHYPTQSQAVRAFRAAMRSAPR
ncbi:Uma2 family endonuclease [Pendulispora albinea]|uniref:Uma2 family endonuclease n=1 Tax=Pendulispora albinea TaxID=2741071 RepID=A0ABZ2LN98_9BACT